MYALFAKVEDLDLQTLSLCCREFNALIDNKDFWLDKIRQINVLIDAKYVEKPYLLAYRKCVKLKTKQVMLLRKVSPALLKEEQTLASLVEKENKTSFLFLKLTERKLTVHIVKPEHLFDNNPPKKILYRQELDRKRSQEIAYLLEMKK